jgi:c-di-GMP-binding flagellar brake protein YcgR
MTPDTQPMPLSTLGGVPDEFRVRDADEIDALLRRLIDTGTALQLQSPSGAHYAAVAWAVDRARDVLAFAVDAHNPQLQRLLESDEVSAVGYLDSVKLQFELAALVLVRGARNSALHAPVPREVFRFQRREGFRVRPLAFGAAPVARLAHPMIPDMQLALRVLDVSFGGCALFLPEDVPPLAPGVRINGVRVELDADTRLHASLALQHVTAIHPESGGARLGCEWVGLGGDGHRSLQIYIDLLQKRRRLLSLD